MKLQNLICGLTLSFAACFVIAASNPEPAIHSTKDTVPLFNPNTIMTEVANKGSSTQITSLDVIGIGLSVENFGQSRVWTEMQKHPKDSIVSPDPSHYEDSGSIRELVSNSNAADTLEWGASQFVEQWPIPSLSIWPTVYGEEEKPDTSLGGKSTFDFYNDRINDLRMPAGMHHHKIFSLGAYFDNNPEDILERAFRFFDLNPEVPVLLLFVSDGEVSRANTGDRSRAKYMEGPRKPDSMPETFVTLLLARRDRVDAMRAFAGTPETALHKAGPPKPGFKASKFLPGPWNAEQFKQFDSLPTIAVIQRPIRITYRKDKDGKPTFDPKQQKSLMPQQRRQAAFKDAFAAALKEVPGGHPTRIFYDAGGPATGANVIPLSLAVHDALPDLEFGKPDEFYDISERIGDISAASPFVQWALGAMTSFEKKDASVTVNMRQAEEATITVILPSNDARKHPMGHPFDFNLAPQDGGPAKSVAPPPQPNKPHASLAVPPVAVAVQPTPVATVRKVTIGTSLTTGDECSQSGMWRCSPPDAQAGNLHFIPAGRTFPMVRVARELGAWQKLRGVPEQANVPATWTLVSYDVPTV
jgi:hypothetical protein